MVEPVSPSVTIITPVFNVEHLIERCIRSVQAQEFGDYIHIIVDDASTDGTARVVKNAAILDPRIVLIEMNSNAGAYRARNLGLEHATGDWVAFIDGDDEWPEDFLSQSVSALMAAPENFVGTFSSVIWLDESGRPLGTAERTSTRYALPDILQLWGNPAGNFSCFVFRASLLEGVRFRTCERVGGDAEMCLRLVSMVPQGELLSLDRVFVKATKRLESATAVMLTPDRYQSLEYRLTEYLPLIDRNARASTFLRFVLRLETYADTNSRAPLDTWRKSQERFLLSQVGVPRFLFAMANYRVRVWLRRSKRFLASQRDRRVAHRRRPSR